MTSPAPADCRIVQYPCSAGPKPPKRLYVPNDDQVITHSITGAGYWDFRVIVNLYGAAARGGCFVEVGGNIGSDTVLAADFFTQCYVFEPAARHVELLRRNLELNQITNVQVFAAAVSDHSGTATLSFPQAGNSGAAYLQDAAPTTAAEQVQVVTLDSALPTISNVTFVHIDTEGHDIKVLQGAHQFIARQTIRPIIKMEFQPQSLARHGSTVDDLLGFTRQFGYNVIFNASGNYVPLSPSILTEIFHLWQASNGWIDIYLWPA